MYNLKNKTPSESYKDLLHVDNGGNGVSDHEHIPVRDGAGNVTGISLGASKVSIDFGGGLASNAVFVSQMHMCESKTHQLSDVLNIDLATDSAKLINYEGDANETTINVSFSSLVDISGSDTGIFAETRLVISAGQDISISFLNENGDTFATVQYTWPNYLSFKIAGFLESATSDPVFFITETESFSRPN
jgi:hypothetical protein